MANNQLYKIEDAIKFVKETNKAKFDATVELHVNLNIDPQKTDQTIRVSTELPHGTGKLVKVAAFATSEVKGADITLGEKDLLKIEKGEIKPKVDFDVVVAEPSFMPKVARVARILGPAGCMPNPKNGTVSDNLEKVVTQIKKGRVEIRNEPNAPIIHVIIGKTSFDDKQLKENYNTVMTTLRQNKPQKAKPEWIKSAFVTSTMGPSAQVEL